MIDMKLYVFVNNNDVVTAVSYMTARSADQMSGEDGEWQLYYAKKHEQMTWSENAINDFKQIKP